MPTTHQRSPTVSQTDREVVRVLLPKLHPLKALLPMELLRPVPEAAAVPPVAVVAEAVATAVVSEHCWAD